MRFTIEFILSLNANYFNKFVTISIRKYTSMKIILPKTSFQLFYPFILIYLLASSEICVGQSKYSHTFFDENTGLKSTSMNDVFYDQSGLIWIANAENLLLFDGHTFTEYPYIHGKDTAYIPHIRYLFEVSDGRLGIATENYFYKINFDFSMEKLDKSKYPEFILNKRNTTYIRNSQYKMYNDVSFFSQRVIEIGGIKYIVNSDSILLKTQGNKKLVLLNHFKPQLFGGIFIFGNKLFCKTFNKIYKYENGKIMNENEPIYLDNKTIPVDKNSMVFQCQTRNYFVNQNGVYSLKLIENKLVANLLISSNELPPEPNKCCMVVSNDERLIVLATKVNGLHIYKKNLIKFYKPTTRLPFSFNTLILANDKIVPNNSINFYWDTSGVSHEKPIPFLGEYNTYCENDTINKHLIFSYNDTTKFYDYNFKLIKHNLFPEPNFFFRYARDKNGNLIGFGPKYFAKIEINGISKLNIPSIEKLFLQRSIIYDAKIWGDTALVASNIGLFLIPLNGEKSSVFLKDKSVRSIVPIKNGLEFIILTYGAGIYLFKDGKFYPINLDEKKMLLHTHSLIFDNNGRVWFPTNRGILCTQFDIWYKSILNNSFQPFYFFFGKDDGLTTLEMNGGAPNSFVKLNGSGRVFLSSVKGLVSFNPESKIIQFPMSPISIVSSIADGQNNFGLPNIIYGNRNVELTINCPYWGNPDNLKLEYLFDSDEDNWQSISREMKINLPRISNGQKKLRIRYRSGFGQQDFHYQSFLLNYNPFWYETFLFKLFIGSLIVFSIIMIIKIRTNYLIKTQKKLEQIIEEKTSEIKLAMVELSDSEKNLRESNLVRKKLVNVLAHDIRSPLKAIIFLSSYIKSKLQEKYQTELEEPIKMVEEVSNSVQGIFDLASDFLVWYNLSQNENFEFKNTSFEIKEIFESNLKIYQPLILAKGNILHTNIEPKLLYNDPSIVTIIIRNLIDNANKYTNGGLIKLEANNTETGFEVVISNGPIHLDSNKIEEIRNKINNKNETYGASGINVGLSLVSFLTYKLQLKISFEYVNSETIKFILIF